MLHYRGGYTGAGFLFVPRGHLCAYGCDCRAASGSGWALLPVLALMAGLLFGRSARPRWF